VLKSEVCAEVGTVDGRLGMISERLGDEGSLHVSVSLGTTDGLCVELIGVGTVSRSPTIAVQTRFPCTRTYCKRPVGNSRIAGK
jgi:hypothetical protein